MCASLHCLNRSYGRESTGSVFTRRSLKNAIVLTSPIARLVFVRERERSLDANCLGEWGGSEGGTSERMGEQSGDSPLSNSTVGLFLDGLEVEMTMVFFILPWSHPSTVIHSEPDGLVHGALALRTRLSLGHKPTKLGMSHLDKVGLASSLASKNV